MSPFLLAIGTEKSVKTLGMANRQGAKKQRVRQAENRGAGANGQAERKDRGRGRQPPFVKLPPREIRVHPQGIEPVLVEFTRAIQMSHRGSS